MYGLVFVVASANVGGGDPPPQATAPAPVLSSDRPVPSAADRLLALETRMTAAEKSLAGIARIEKALAERPTPAAASAPAAAPMTVAYVPQYVPQYADPAGGGGCAAGYSTGGGSCGGGSCGGGGFGYRLFHPFRCK